MYAEQFKITATEVGFVQRLLRTYRNDLPACQGGPLVHPTVLAGVTTPFTVLAAGFASSLIVFTLEKIVYSVQNISQQE
uniref:Uncharacterized protein n=1 Tax=Anopheles christyi TaxID=43041 RepID=A0A182K2U8_9DIPT